MSGVLLLDWAVIALSLFNTILLFWLGLTILLTAERREWGVWFVGAGALTGAGFFVSHTVLLGVGWVYFTPAVDFWWRAGMLPLVLCPWLWYLALLWYAGLWGQPDRKLRRVHLPGLAAMSLFGLALLLAALLEDPAQQIPRLLSLDLGLTGRLLLLYPLYTIGCTGLALHALRRPAPEPLPARARRRKAQPWLVLSTLILLVVSLLVAGALVWILENSLRTGLDRALVLSILVIDAAIAGLIAVSMLLMGQAVVTYEIFSSRSLPRAGLRRQWARVIILSAGYSLVIGAVFALQLPAVYGLLLTALLMTAFFALLGWRTLAERRALLEVLRPFVSGEKMYPAIIGKEAIEIDLQAPFSALCTGVLNCRYALLAPAGAFRTLLGQDLVYPPGQALEAPALPARAAAATEFLPLAEQSGQVYRWGVPLFNEAGLTGYLFLGPKVGEALYVQEELELAQAACERLVDMQASATLSRYLLELQRQELAETAILDRRSRRVLHDEILPQVHALILQAQGKSAPAVLDGLAAIHGQLSDLLHSMPPTSSPQFQKIGVLAALRQVVAVEFGEAFAGVDWQIEPQAADCLAALPPLSQEVLYYAARELVRNAARHARAPGGPALLLTIRLRLGEEIELAIQDSGPGLSEGGLAAVSGGYGLGLHAAMLAVIGGSLALENQEGLTARVRLPRPAG